jgi:hypothetical protein
MKYTFSIKNRVSKFSFKRTDKLKALKILFSLLLKTDNIKNRGDREWMIKALRIHINDVFEA